MYFLVLDNTENKFILFIIKVLSLNQNLMLKVGTPTIKYMQEAFEFNKKKSVQTYLQIIFIFIILNNSIKIYFIVILALGISQALVHEKNRSPPNFLNGLNLTNNLYMTKFMFKVQEGLQWCRTIF